MRHGGLSPLGGGSCEYRGGEVRCREQGASRGAVMGRDGHADHHRVQVERQGAGVRTDVELPVSEAPVETGFIAAVVSRRRPDACRATNAARLGRSGVPIELDVYPGAFHGSDLVPGAATDRLAVDLANTVEAMMMTAAVESCGRRGIDRYGDQRPQRT